MNDKEFFTQYPEGAAIKLKDGRVGYFRTVEELEQALEEGSLKYAFNISFQEPIEEESKILT